MRFGFFSIFGELAFQKMFKQRYSSLISASSESDEEEDSELRYEVDSAKKAIQKAKQEVEEEMRAKEEADTKAVEDRKARKQADELGEIEEGRSLSEGLTKHSHIFSNLFVNMVKAGESSGMLDEILDRLALYLEKTNALRKKVKSAMIYPAVVSVMALATELSVLAQY